MDEFNTHLAQVNCRYSYISEGTFLPRKEDFLGAFTSRNGPERTGMDIHNRNGPQNYPKYKF